MVATVRIAEGLRCRLIGCVAGGADPTSGGWRGSGRSGRGGGRKRTLPAGTAAEIVRVTTTERPRYGSTHWTVRTLAARIGVGRETVGRVWPADGLRPWRAETFKLSRDLYFADVRIRSEAAR
jgi:hypothetical protein